MFKNSLAITPSDLFLWKSSPRFIKVPKHTPSLSMRLVTSVKTVSYRKRIFLVGGIETRERCSYRRKSN